MRCKPRYELLLLSPVLLSGIGILAQYDPPATPAPYNPIALAEVTGTPRAAVQAGQNNYQVLSQNPYLGGVPGGKRSATPVLLSLDDAVALGLKQNLGAVLSTDAVTDARGQRWEALSELLPNVVTNMGFGVHQINVNRLLESLLDCGAHRSKGGLSLVRSHSSTLRRASGAIGIMPALFTRTSILPYVAMAFCIRASTCVRTVTSTGTANAVPPSASIFFTIASRRSVRLAPRTTFAPNFARWRAVLSPRPLLAPVMTTTFPSMFCS